MFLPVLVAVGTSRVPHPRRDAERVGEVMGQDGLGHHGGSRLAVELEDLLAVVTCVTRAIQTYTTYILTSIPTLS